MKKPNLVVKYLLTIMRITLCQIVLAALFSGFSLAAANSAAGQGVLEKTISVSAENRILRGVLSDIEKSAQVKFSFNPKSIPVNSKVSVDFQQMKLGDVLNHLLEPLEVVYQVSGEYIILSKSRLSSEVSDASSVNVSVARNITGVVRDETNSPLPGVNVLEKGTMNGTTTDADGRFSLSVSGDESVLVLSFIGYATQEVTVGTQTAFNISLVPDIRSLEEVVVVGFGTQIKKDVTGSIASIDEDQLKNIPVASPDALLQGRAAGVQVVQNSGTPGGEVFVRIRGTASLLGETRPLFVVDGVPMNNSTSVAAGGQRSSVLADINPNDIETMDILKDAAATAIYGSRGSNGVVIITTKRGKSGRARINFDAYQGVQSVPKTLDLLNGQQFVDLLRDELTNRNPSLLNQAPYNQLAVSGENTDYQNEVFRAAPISSYTISLTGGDDKVSTYLSLSNFKQEGTIIGQDYDRFTGRINLDYRATPKLKVGTSTTFSTIKQARVENDFGGYSVLGNALLRDPNLPVRNADGSYSIDPLQSENPVQLANEITFNSFQRRIVSNIYAEYKILESLTFRSVIGVDYLDDRVERYTPSFILGRRGRAEARAINMDEQTFVNDNTLTYTKQWNNQKLTVLAGLGIQRSLYTRLEAGGQTAGSDIVKTLAIADPYIPSHRITPWRLLSYFGRANYSFRDKYLLEASFRMDGSSRFGQNNIYGAFPGVSFGWRVSEESFMQNVTLFDDLKFRVGYGVTGNQEGIGAYSWRALYSVGRNYDGNPGIGQANIPNPDLGWESTATTNVGIDAAFAGGRINVTAEAYLKKTDNLIFQRQLPWTSGFWNIANANIGEMENRGIELSVGTRNLTGAFTWSTDFNISFNRTEITSLPVNGQLGSDFVFKMPDAFGAEGPYSIYRIGQPIGSFFGHVYQGVYASDEDVPRIADPTNTITDLYERGVRGGDANFLDMNGDGTINRQFDRAIIGNALPKHIGGITNTFGYKGIDLSVVINWSYGNDIYNMTRSVLTSMVDDYNQSTEVLSRWKQQGDITNVPKAIYGSSAVSGAAPNDASSRYIEDGSFIRFRNIALGYNLPTAMVKRISLSSARVYVSGQNLITITNYTGMDPENQNLGNGTPSLGVDYLTQPQPRVVMAGVTLGF